MNLCVISCQAILLAVLVIQIHYSEVEAEKQISSSEKWYNNLQKKTENVLDDMKRGTQKGFKLITRFSEGVLDNIKHAFRIVTNKKHKTTKVHKEEVKTNLSNTKEHTNYISVNIRRDGSNCSNEEKNDDDNTDTQRIPLEKLESYKKKKSIKKHKKRKNKGKHKQIEHASNDKISDANDELYKPEFTRRDRKNDKKKHSGTRKFVKITQRDSNNSESDEAVRRKPVDIIVHIKMNE